MNKNIILMADSYKFSHHLLLPNNTQFSSSYIEARGPEGKSTVFFGLQMLIKEYLRDPVTTDMIDEAEELITTHGLPFNRKGWEDIRDLGYLPIRIQAIPEGTLAPVSVPLVQITNTLPGFAWLPAFLETIILRSVWYPTTVATNSFNIKKVIMGYLEETADNPADKVNFMLHDFGMRGVSSEESSGIGGCAHLVNFMGTDTVSALRYARKYYDEPCAGYSVCASEHSVSTSFGRDEGELAYIDRILTLIENGAHIASIVADTYDIYNFTKHLIGEVFAERIKNLSGRLVIRPDSGDPTVVPLEIIQILGDAFGYTINKKGFKVLPDFIRVIQGDGINQDSIRVILRKMRDKYWSAENIVFGMGGKLLGAPQRDDFKFAQKANEVIISGKRIAIQKNPVTDSGKSSKAGRQAVCVKDGVLVATLAEDTPASENILLNVYEDGLMIRDYKFSEIREKTKSYL